MSSTCVTLFTQADTCRYNTAAAQAPLQATARAMNNTDRNAALQDKLPTLLAELLVLQQKCTSWYQ